MALPQAYATSLIPSDQGGFTTAVPHHTLEDLASTSHKTVFKGFPASFPAEQGMFQVQSSPEVISLQIRRREPTPGNQRK